ncbi:MAG: tRNA pseudouridine(55) synthase TruB [Gemmatimonadota bacterium]
MLVDKPVGVTSHDVVARVRRLFGTRDVGHTGTLDPFATGLLVLVLGRATRLARFIEAGLKTYLADARLGVRTTTDDLTGTVVDEPAGPPAEWPAQGAVAEALEALTGRVKQRPPAFSAKKIGGRRSYELARSGTLLELEAVDVLIESVALLEYAPPRLRFRAEVGPGTYIRALVRDLGDGLGLGAHCTGLRRERVGSLRIDDAVPLAALTGGEPLIAPADLVGMLPRVRLDAAEVSAVRHGRAIGTAGAGAGRAALVEGDELIAIAESRSGRWQPTVVLSQA